MSTNQHHSHQHGSSHHKPAAQHPRHPHSQDEPASVLQPAGQPNAGPDSHEQAVELIRQKVAALYATNEPDAKQEMQEALLPGVKHSKHQQFMRSLHDSNRSQTEIQAEWHQYYLSLSDSEKRQVWQEFYDQNAQARQQPSRLQPKYTYQPEVQATAAVPATNSQPDPERQHPAPEQPASIYPTPIATSGSVPGTPAQPIAISNNPLYGASMPQPGTTQATPPMQPEAPAIPAPTGQSDSIRRQIRDTVSRRGKLQTKHHLQSLFFGLGFGALTLLIVLFSFFNEVVIAPFIQPSRQVSATPIIASPDGIAASDKDEVIIPKINVQIPLDFSATSTDEKQFEAALDKGVAHYPTTALPGQKGNASFFGHSSNNIFNPGKYKFAFVLLNQLVPGDTFYINYKGVAYAYQIYDKQVVEATAVEILNPVEGKPATAMLVTCDPPGTSLRRLAVWGQQVSPSPDSNLAASTSTGANGKQPTASEALPGNGPTLWGRLARWITGN